MTGLKIKNGCLTELPDSIFELDNLKELLFFCSELKQIPEAIGQLNNLTKLKLGCKNLENLPKALAQLTCLNWIYVPTNLIDQLPMKFIQKYRDDEFGIQEPPSTMLYSPSDGEYSISWNGFFLTSDNWNEETLQNLKYKTGADLIIGLKTTQKSIEKFDVIDGIILCKNNEIKPIIRLIEKTINQLQIIGVDYNDFRETMRFNKPTHFIKSCVFGVDEIDRAQKTVTQLLSQIPQNITIKKMIIMVKNNSSISLDELHVISEDVESRVTEEGYTWYTMELFDKPDCFCIEAIYMVE